MKKVEKITKLPITSVWKHEAKNLTPWLCANIDTLGDSIGLELTSPEPEQSTGNFNVDIKAETKDGDIVVIENQFGASNHDHLGKLITYLTAFDAKIAIWVVETPKQEHINAINWLNESENSCDFYLIKLEAICIGDSSPAPLFTQIAAPSEESKDLGKIKKEDGERHRLRYKFWSYFLDLAKIKKLTSFNNISPSRDSWIASGSGKGGVQYTFWINKNNIRLELRIDRGKGKDDENRKIFNHFCKYKDQIESTFGDTLAWENNEQYRVCAIRKDYSTGGYRNEDNYEAIASNAIEAMIRLEKATKEIIRSIDAI